MAMIDDINLQAHDVVGADVHGDPGVYTTQAGVEVEGRFERLPSTFESEFGDTEREYDVMSVLVSSSLVSTPREVGRTGSGDSIVFDDEPGVTWYVRRIQNHGRAGGFHRLVCTGNYRGPIEGL